MHACTGDIGIYPGVAGGHVMIRYQVLFSSEYLATAACYSQNAATASQQLEMYSNCIV